MTIYLYVKTHKKTGLKYLGMTTKKDPHKYQGSGTYWEDHIRVHGYDVQTEILHECQTIDELRELGIHYSKLWNIVESDEWANLKEESGDGGDTSMTDAYKAHVERIKIEFKKRRWWNNGQKSVHTEHPPDNSYVLGRLYFNNVGAAAGANVQRGRFWVNDGNHEMMMFPGEKIPDGYIIGRIDSPKKNKPNLKTSGTKWWNNGIKTKMSRECPGTDWRQGRL